MERTFQCPSCGSANTVTNPGILMKVCDFCRTALYWDKESAMRVGRESVDLPPSRRFKIGGTGKIKGKEFRVLGRLYYAHEKGTWDEWFLELDDGKIVWLAEDEGELFLESQMVLTTPAPPFEELKPGREIILNDKVGVIEELGQATCLGAQGEIPFPVELEETYNYADGTGVDGDFSFGLEYDNEGGDPTAFIGKALSTRAAKAGAGNRQEAIRKTGEAIRCASCGRPYDGKMVDTTEMIVCDSCGANLQLDEAETRVIGQNSIRQPLFSLPLGTPVTLEETDWEVMGRIYYVEVDEGIEYSSYEYVLYNPRDGYLWLSEERGHFTVSRPLHLRAKIPEWIWPKEKVTIGGETYKAYEQGTLEIRYVDGALPWVASVGETTQYTALTKPPEYVEREITGNEMELFKGRYVDREEIAKAVPDTVTLPIPRSVYFCQPYKPSVWTEGLAVIGILFLVVNLVLLVFSAVSDRSKVVLEQRFTADQYSTEVLTNAFEIPNDRTILRLTGSAPLKNSWVALAFALVNSDDQVIEEFDTEASFYEGRDSEGYWSEGSQHFKTFFWVPKAGTYKLLVYGTGGSGNAGPARKEPVSVKIERGATISSYFLWPLIMALVVTIVPFLGKMMHDSARWSEVIEDDDDD